MNISTPIPTSIESVSFSTLSADDIRRISIKQVTNPVLFNNINEPNQGGLYDPVFGVRGRGDVCPTCRLSSFDCPGHFGHIELPAPVFHPLYFTQAYHLFRGMCTYCHHLLIPRALTLRYIAKLTLLEHGLVAQAAAIDTFSFEVDDAPKAADKADKGHSTLNKDEQLSNFEQRLNLWVNISITRAKTSRDEYKNSPAAFAQRKATIHEFFKALPKKRCEHCGAYSHRLRKEGHTKLIEYSLVPKQLGVHAAMHISRPNVLKPLQESDLIGKAPRNGKETRMDVDGASSDSEAESDTAVSEVEPLESLGKQRERIVSPEEVRGHFRRLFRLETAILALIYAPHGPMSDAGAASASAMAPALADIFFCEVISVPPTRFRPPAQMGDQVFENPQNSLLNAILKQTFLVRDINADLTLASADPTREKEVPALYTRLLESLINLQIAVNSFMDSTKNPAVMRGGKLPPMGVKQLLEKKEGLFRMNMMGKRVNYAARSVISPDVNIETNEIGVPPVFARKLTFPEPVTAHNVNWLRQLVINGPHIHPGAAFIETEDGSLISLDHLSEEERTAHANRLLAPSSRTTSSRPDAPDSGLPSTHTPQLNRKVYRHLVDGDIVILNRQPTLHKPSMMCHRVKVLPGEKTIRMHYANCNSYNADFDGDEMNMHFPQSLTAQAEARFIANTDNQYLAATSGGPLRGLIQDHVVSGVWLSNKDTFFTRAQYQQLLYGALKTEDGYLNGAITLLPPAVWKPVPLWTGKQVFSTVVRNITPPLAGGLHFRCKGKVAGPAWGEHTEEGEVLFFDGEMLTGIIDKAQIGASAYGLVHSVYEVYGAAAAGKLLSILSRLLTKFLQTRAFSCRMDDLILSPKGDAIRRDLLQSVNEKGLAASLDYVGLGTADRDAPATEQGLRARLEEVLRDDNKLAGLDASVEGETNQVTTRVIKECLPHNLVKPFPANNMQTMTLSGAKGSNVNASQISCLLGQQSLEGRRVPVMVSGKTLPSFKAFETAPRAGGFVAGRFLTGIRPQEYFFHCMAGREGLIDTAVKTSRSGYLQRCLIKHLEGIRVHYDHTVRNADQSVLQFHYGEDSLDVTRQKHLLQVEFALRNMESLVQKLLPKQLVARTTQIDPSDVKKVLKRPERYAPLLSDLSPSRHLGAVSERYAAAIEDYIASNPQRLLKTKKKYRADWPAFVRTDELVGLEHFRSLMYMRYMRSLVDPGEAVGLLAAQGVGEPSTQMTLNTFHFAGHGAANVTLGIPRLREIVMTASQKIKTPTMQLHLRKGVTAEQTAVLCQRATRLSLSSLVDRVQVSEWLSSKDAGLRRRLYRIRLELFPAEDYASEHHVTPLDVLQGIQRTFVPLFDRAILREFKKVDKELRGQVESAGKGQRMTLRADLDDNVDVGHDAASDVEEGDADDARRARQNKDEMSYEDADDPSDARGGEGEGEGDAEGMAGASSSDSEADLEAAFDSDDEDGTSVSSEDEGPRKAAPVASSPALDAQYATLETRISRSSRYIDAARFDREQGAWCELDMEVASDTHKLLLVGIVEQVCRASIIHAIPGISRAFVPKNSTAEDPTIITEGENLRAMWEFAHEYVDLDRIYTNEIGAVLHTYGVEAARTSIIREMSAVFSVYGIGVDYRHLSLIADYMTNDGGYKPFNRTGLSTSSSPFLKASYETTASVIADASLYGDFDDLTSPSANVVMGKIAKSGTGVFAVRSVVEASV